MKKIGWCLKQKKGIELVEETMDNCSGFSWLKCFLFGDSSKRPVAGAASYQRGGV